MRTGVRPTGGSACGGVSLRPPVALAGGREPDSFYSGGGRAAVAASPEILAVLRTDRPLALADTASLRAAAADAVALVRAAAAPAGGGPSRDGWEDDAWLDAVADVRGQTEEERDAARECASSLVGVVAAWQPMSTPRGLRRAWGDDAAASEARWLQGEAALLAGGRDCVSQAVWPVRGREAGTAAWAEAPDVVEVGGLDFVQAHRDGASVLYAEAARALMDLRDAGAVPEAPSCLELFSGSGALTLAVRHVVGRTVSAELMPAAVRRAKEAFEAAGAASAEAVQADLSSEAGWAAVEAALGRRPADVVLANPPRTGLPGFAVDALRTRLGPRAIVYLSCKPETLARDAALLARDGDVAAYDLLRAQPVDMFPHSPHVETVAVLVRRPPGAGSAAL